MNMTSSPTRSLVSLRGVRKHYRLGEIVTSALTDIALDIKENCFTVLNGPSGSGKTTLLNLVGGLDRPDHGSVLIDGVDIQSLDDKALSDLRQRRIGFIFQNFNLLPVLTAYENVEYPLILGKVPQTARKERVLQALDDVGLQDHCHKRPDQLSGGQRQRVAIARALVKNPLIVLADEPTANLDSETGASVIALMRDMQRRHKVSFVFSSHDQQVLAEADHVVRLRDGRIVDSRTTSSS